VISDKETNNLSKENFNKNSLINLKNLLNDFFEKQKNVQTKDLLLLIFFKSVKSNSGILG